MAAAAGGEILELACAAADALWPHGWCVPRDVFGDSLAHQHGGSAAALTSEALQAAVFDDVQVHGGLLAAAGHMATVYDAHWPVHRAR